MFLIFCIVGKKRSHQNSPELEPFLENSSSQKRQRTTISSLNLKLEKWEYIEDRFNELAEQICESLEKREISPRTLLSRVQGIDCLPMKLDEHSPFSKEKQECENCNTISDMWCHFGKYFTFFSYRLLKAVARALGTEKDKKKLHTYEEEFMRYTKKVIVEHYDSHDVSIDGTTTITVKISEQFETFSRTHIDKFKVNIAKVLAVPSHHLHLVDLKPGCVELAYHSPYYIELEAFPLSVDQEIALLDLGVIRLQCGKYKFPKEVCNNYCINAIVKQHYYTEASKISKRCM